MTVLVDDFVRRFGHPPDGVWSAPGRANLIGEHVDYAEGLCLPFALPLRTRVAVSARHDDRVRVASRQEVEGWTGALADVGPGRPGGWAGYAVGVLWALRDAGYPAGGLDVLVDGAVPAGAGLSSSAALECAVALAADELAGLGLGGSDDGRRVLAQVCRRAENDVVGAATGGLDQAASLRCLDGHALLLDCRDGSARHIGLDLPGATLLVIDTRAPHRHVGGEYADRRRAVEAAATALGLGSLRDATLGDLDRLPDAVLHRRARHVVTEIERVRETIRLLSSGDLAGVGRVLDVSHLSLRDDLQVSCAELDTCAAAARGAGAFGARMTGGGFGGSVVALAPVGAQHEVRIAVREAAARAGFPDPVVYPVLPGPGAHRDC